MWVRHRAYKRYRLGPLSFNFTMHWFIPRFSSWGWKVLGHTWNSKRGHRTNTWGPGGLIWGKGKRK